MQESQRFEEEKHKVWDVEMPLQWKGRQFTDIVNGVALCMLIKLLVLDPLDVNTFIALIMQVTIAWAVIDGSTWYRNNLPPLIPVHGAVWVRGGQRMIPGQDPINVPLVVSSDFDSKSREALRKNGRKE